MTLTRRPGQRVLISGGKYHGAARIEKVLQKNVDIKMEAGGMKVRAHPSFLTDLDETAPVPSQYTAITATLTEVPTQPVGALVSVQGKTGVYVVIADKFDRINVALLGGEGGRYWRQPRATITPWTPDEVQDLLER